MCATRSAAVRPPRCRRSILVGQLLVQLPPQKDSGAPAILKLLVDVVGFYDADTRVPADPGPAARLVRRHRGRSPSSTSPANCCWRSSSARTPPSSCRPAGSTRVRRPAASGYRATLDRLRVSFGIGPVKLPIEHVLRSHAQLGSGGQKTALSADFGVASIEASLGWDALLYLSPRFYFIVDLEFKAKVKAFGETLASVTVSATLEGPDRVAHLRRVQLLDPLVGQDRPLRRALGRGRRPRRGHRLAQQALLPELVQPR